MIPTRSGADAPTALPCHRRGAVRVRQDLPRLDQEHRPGSSQRDVVRAAVDEADAQLTFEPLHLLAQRRLDDVLPLRCPAEVQLLGQRHEIAELAQLHTRRQVRVRSIPVLLATARWIAGRGITAIGSD